MLLRVPGVLTIDALAHCRTIVEHADWHDGKITAGLQSAQVKNNSQLPEDAPASREARALVAAGLAQSALFFSSALPKKTFPPLFNRYQGDGNSFGEHVDNAVRTSAVTGAWVRTDLSATLFLSEVDEYEGGELVLEDTFGTQRVKLAVGELLLYSASSLHRVEPVTSGVRLASFFWIESMARSEEQRRLLFELDAAIVALRTQQGDTDETARLTGVDHNLLRLWVET